METSVDRYVTQERNSDFSCIDRIRELSVRQLFEPAVIGVIEQDLVTNVQENLRVELSLKSLSPLNTITSKVIVIGADCNSAQVDRNIQKICTPDDSHMSYPSRVGTTGFNVGVFSPLRGSNSTVSTCVAW